MALDKTARREFMHKVRPLLEADEFNKVGAAITPYVRLRVYEDSFADRVLAVRTVTEQELIPEIQDDSYYVITNVEQPTSHAHVANFMNHSPERYLAGERYKIPLGKHATPIARKNKNELLAYNYDLLADAAEKDVQKLGELRDSKLIRMMNECVRLSGKRHDDVVNPDSTGPVQINKVHTNRLASVLQTGGRSGRPAEDILKATRFLLNDETRSDFSLLDYEVLGHDLTRDVFVNGFTTKTLQGIEYIASIKMNLLTEEEPVTLLTFGAATAADEDIVVNGVTFTIPSGTAAADIAQNLADQINASTDALIRETVDEAATVYVRAEVAGETLRIVSSPEWSEDDHRFTAAQVSIDASAMAQAPTQKKGADFYDIIWAFPDAEFMGEIIRVSGRDIEPEIWKTPGEETINRTMREWFGMGIGNENGVAKLRMQRGRYLGQ